MGLTVHFPYSLPLKMAAHIQKYAEICRNCLPCDITCTPFISMVSSPDLIWSVYHFQYNKKYVLCLESRLELIIFVWIVHVQLRFSCVLHFYTPGLIHLGCTKMLCECFLITEKALINFSALCADDCLLHNLLAALQLPPPPSEKCPKVASQGCYCVKCLHPDTPT